jgi:signal peptidase II
MKIYRYFIVAIIVILIDQASKLLVYNNMYLHEEIYVMGDWFRIHYLLNPGMAFGIRWDNEFGKLALTTFRIAAMIGIAFYLWKMAVRGANNGFLWCMGLILGGAVGNVVDSTFYGVLLNNAPVNSPTRWFHGQVIDMLYFPMFDLVWPQWLPLIGGTYFEFFSPVFNIADSSIFIGVVIILSMQRKFFKEKILEETTHTMQTMTESIENKAAEIPTDSSQQNSANIL